MEKIILVAIIVCNVVGVSIAQISSGGQPLSYNLPLLSEVAPPTVRVYGFEAAQVALEDAMEDPLGKAPRYAKLLSAGFNLQNSGEWTSLKNGDRVWRLRIESAGADALTLFYDDFSIPEGGRLYLYNDERKQHIGAYTSFNNHEGGPYATELVFGEAVVLEYFEPGHATGLGRLSIEHVGHAYRYVLDDEPTSDEDMGQRGGEPCQVDINCSPEGTNWQDEKRGVVRVSVVDGQGAGWCTASMVNNTALNCRNFVLSALHCGDNSSASHFGQYIFYFNYERTGCDAGSSSESQTMTGCVKRAESNDGGGSNGSDFMLLELNSNPPANYNVYYNGWNKQNTASSSGVSIHHPAGGRKKVSTYTTALTTGGWGINNTHWDVTWAATTNGHGVTEGGSSGSPIFNSSGLIVGTLTGGGSFCNTPTQPDSYGKMSYHWGSNPGDDLSVWLDPSNTGVNSLAGTYAPCTPLNTLDVGISSVSSPSGSICATSITPVVVLRNSGSTTVTSAQILFNVDGQNQQTFNWTGSLATNQTVLVTLPAMNVTAGNHVFNASTNLPNGQADQNAANNASNSSFTVVTADTYVTLHLTTDNYGSETTWQVTQSGGGVVASGGPYTDAVVSFIEQDICVQSGLCYTFTINDSQGDGICCDYGVGSYSLGDANGISIYTGAAFATSQQVNFCVPTGSNCDTVYDPFGTAASGFTLYANSGGGYVSGSNSFDDEAKAQVFPAPSGAYEVAGVVFWAGAKTNGGGSIAVNLYDRNGAGVTVAGNVSNAPGTVLATLNVPLSRVDTSSFLNYAEFNAPVVIGGAYAVGIDFSTFGTNDQIGIVTNVDGDAGNAERSWEKWSDNTWHTMDQGWSSASDGKFDLGIFPVLCPLNVTGLDAEPQHTLMVYPNPSTGRLNIGYVLSSGENAEIQVVTGLGQLIHSEAVNGNVGSVNLALNDHPSGMYLIRLLTDNGTIVHKWIKQD